jgi:hypothetical protein
MLLRWLRCACCSTAAVASLAIAQVPAAPGTLPPARVVSIGFKGLIKPQDVGRVEQAVALAGAEALPARLIVFFDSSGGDGFAAMRIGRLLRRAKAHVFVTGHCASACIFAYAGGVYRDAKPGSLGIHRGKLTATNVEGKTIDVDPRQNAQARDFLEYAQEQTREYFAQMGLPDRLYWAMQTVPPNQMRWLSTEEAKDLGLVGFDPDYLAERAEEVEARYGVARADYVQRTSEVLDQCAVDAPRYTAFVGCYKAELLGKR